jgi:hypothetical protein
MVIDAQRPVIEIHQEITARITALTAKK